MKKLAILASLFISLSAQAQLVRIHKLNDCSDYAIEQTQKTIEKYFGLQVMVSEKNYSTSDNSESIDCLDLNESLFGYRNFQFKKSKPIDIFLTTSNINSVKRQTNIGEDEITYEKVNVNGVSFGNSIYIKTLDISKLKFTIIHELSHSFGAEHCQNICIMNVEYTLKQREKIWDYAKDKPIFCKNCRIQSKIK